MSVETPTAAAGDDPVVRELSVFVSRGPHGRLWLLQYPVRPAARGSCSDRASTARLRVGHQQLEMELPLDCESASYDPGRGQQIALNADGSRLTRDPADLLFPAGLMDRHVLRGRRLGVDARRYCVAVLTDDGEMHISPLAAVLAVRPDFQYVDRSDARGRREARELGDVAIEEEPESTAERVTVRFQRPEPDRLRLARERSFQSVQRRQDAEPWLTARVHDPDSAACRAERSRLQCGTPSDELPAAPACVAPLAFRRRLLPDPPEPEAAAASDSVSLRRLRTLPLPDQLRGLLRRLQLASLSQLVGHLSAGVTAAETVRLVQQCGRLVRGLWAVRSELLYPNDQRLADARDLLLYWLTQMQHVTREQLVGAGRVSADEALQLLEPLATLQRPHGWQLRLRADPHMEKCYPEVCQRQKLMWEARFGQLQQQQPAAAGQQSPLKKPPQQLRRRRRSQRDSACSASDTEPVTVKPEPLSSPS